MGKSVRLDKRSGTFLPRDSSGVLSGPALWALASGPTVGTATERIRVAAGDTVPTAGPRWETPCVLQGLRALQREADQVVDARDWTVPSAAGLCSLWAGLWWSPLALFLQNLCYPLH